MLATASRREKGYIRYTLGVVLSRRLFYIEAAAAMLRRQITSYGTTKNSAVSCDGWQTSK